MTENDLNKIRLKKAEMLLKTQSMPTDIVKIDIVKIHSAEEFEDLKKEHPDTILIVDFWAVWCSPCMMFAPVFEKIQKEHSQEFIFVKINVDEVGSIAQTYRITGIPTTLFIKNNRCL